jgi:glutathione S-transferase
VPVLTLEDGRVVTDSRRISEVLVAEGAGLSLVPPGLEGPVWAFADWCDAVLEDAAFRLASPGIRDRFGSAWERSLFVFVKERKFGPGCVQRWEEERDALATRVSALLAPVERTLSQRPFVFGEQPTLADAALYGQLAMLAYADPALPERLSAPVARHAQRLARLLDPVRG